MKKIIAYRTAMVFVMMFLVSTHSFAQGPGGGPGPCTSPPCNPPNPPGLAPIDGGLVFLIASGLILGVRDLRKKE